MGRAIYYCVQCSQRVSDSDIDAGKGFRIGERILCFDCAPPGTKPTPSSKKIPPASRKNSGTSVALRSVNAPLATPQPAPDPAETGGRRRLLILGGGISAGAV